MSASWFLVSVFLNDPRDLGTLRTSVQSAGGSIDTGESRGRPGACLAFGFGATPMNGRRVNGDGSGKRAYSSYQPQRNWHVERRHPTPQTQKPSANSQTACS